MGNNLLPPDFFPMERICAFCEFYTFRDREPGDTRRGLAFCRHFGKHFLFQLSEPDKNGEIHKPAGERGADCNHWRQKGTVDADS